MSAKAKADAEFRERLARLRGSLKGGHALRTLEEERAKDREREEAKIAY